MRWIIAAAFGLLLTAGVSSGAESASRIVDRTLVCRATGVGFPDPVRYLDVHASPRIGKDAPSVRVYNGPSGADGMGAGLYTGPFAGRTTGSVWFSRTQCTATRPRLPFSTTGLRGGRAELFGERHKCDVPATVLIRVRAVFALPVTLKPDARAPYLSVAKGKITSASLAVTTALRKPIAFGSVDDKTGQARIFVSPSRCFRQ